MPRQTVSYPNQSWSNYTPQMQQQTGIAVPSFPTSRTTVATVGQGAQQAVVLAAPSIPYPGLPDASAGQGYAQTVFTPPTGTTTMFTQTPTQQLQPQFTYQYNPTTPQPQQVVNTQGFQYVMNKSDPPGMNSSSN